MNSFLVFEVTMPKEYLSVFSDVSRSCIPAKAHVSHLQISSSAAIDAEIAEAENSLDSGATLFIGGHGGAATRDAVEFKIAYLKKVKELLAANNTAQAFVNALKEAWPGLPEEAGLEDLGKALYK